MFLKLYQGLKKHLSFRGWTSSQPTTAANGIAQGCSFSLLAINVYIAVWSKFMSLIPGILAKAFIDDAYFWAKLSNLAHLRIAFEVTEQWNNLVGQRLNPEKSSPKGARKTAAAIFPQIPAVLEFDALGTKIYTSERKSFLVDDEKTSKICMDIKNISALPVKGYVKEKLIATKIIPQFSFASDISSIPEKALNQFESGIASALWGHRPHWRSKMMIFTFLSQPCHTEPTVVRAHTALRNFWRFLHDHPNLLGRLRAVFQSSIGKPHSLLRHVSEACEIFHLRLFPHLQVGIGKHKFDILDICFRDFPTFSAPWADRMPMNESVFERIRIL